MLQLQMLYFEDLSLGMTETLQKVIDASDVVGFAEVTAIAIRSISPSILLPRPHLARALRTGSTRPV